MESETEMSDKKGTSRPVFSVRSIIMMSMEIRLAKVGHPFEVYLMSMIPTGRRSENRPWLLCNCMNKQVEK